MQMGGSQSAGDLLFRIYVAAILQCPFNDRKHSRIVQLSPAYSAIYVIACKTRYQDTVRCQCGGEQNSVILYSPEWPESAPRIP